MADEINLGGWDIAFAMRYGDINAVIADMVAKERAAAPQPGMIVFPQTVSLSGSNALGVTTTLEGSNITSWRLKSGGDGQNVVIGFTIPEATIAITGASAKTVSSVSVAIDVDARIEQQPNGSFSIAPRSSQGWVRPSYDFTRSTETLSNIEQTSVNSLLIEWVEGLMPTFMKFITKIDTALGTNQQDWTWLIPQVSEAVVHEPPGTPEDDFMVIIRSMTTTKNIPAVTSLSGDLIPDQASVGIAIGPQLFLEKMVVGALYLLFDDAQTSDFTVSGTRITTSKAFSIKNFYPNPNETGPGDAVKASFNNFKVEIIGDHLEFASDITFPYKAVTVSTSYRSLMRLSLKTGQVTVSSTGQTVDLAMPEVTNTLTEATNTNISASADLNIASLVVGVAVIVAGAIFAASQVASGEEEPPGVADESTQGGVQMSTLSDVSGTASDMSVSESEDTLDTLSSAASDEAPPRLFGHTRMYWMKTAGVGFATLLIGGGIASIPGWIKLADEGEAEQVIRDLRTFLTEVLKVVSLPQGVAEDYELTSIGLNGTLVIGAKPKA